jgi:DNA polymerase I-like protein with 3'-5' exonuclease and polymerase domains
VNLTGFDFETSGELPEYALQPWRVKQGKAWATSLAIIHQTGDSLTREGGLNPDRDMMAAMMEYAIKNKQPICGWNVTFDISWLLAYGLEELVFKCAWLDGMLLWKHYFIEPEYDQNRANKKSYKLQECIDQYMPHLSGYKDEVDFHNPDPEVRRHLHQINIKDTVAALTMTEFMWEEMLTDSQRVAARIEAKCLPLVAKANLEGLRVDTVHTSNLGRKLIFDAKVALAAVGPHGATEEIVASPLKLAKLLFDDWGLPVLKTNVGAKTGKTSRSTDKEVLHELSLKDERVRHIRNWREALGNKVKFADNILESVGYNCDGCTHPSAMVFGTYTGRLTYASKQGKNKDERQTGFAIHQEKNDPFYRGAIVVPADHALLELDAMGQEFRWMAIASGDPTMLHLCLPGEDAHSYMGVQIDVDRSASPADREADYRRLIDLVKHEDVAAKLIRKMGKVGNLSLQYRTSAPRLMSVARVQYDIPMMLAQAERIHRTYQLTYKEVPKYWARQIRLVKGLGYAETYAGRRVKVSGNWNGSTKWQLESTAINYPIQGTGGEMKYLALAVLKAYLVKWNIRFLWDMHDGLYFAVPVSILDRAAVEMKWLLDNLPYEKAWGFKPPIPLPWECKVGYSWGQLLEYEA